MCSLAELLMRAVRRPLVQQSARRASRFPQAMPARQYLEQQSLERTAPAESQPEPLQPAAVLDQNKRAELEHCQTVGTPRPVAL